MCLLRSMIGNHDNSIWLYLDQHIHKKQWMKKRFHLFIITFHSRYDWPENVQPEVLKVLNRNNNRTDNRCHCNNRLEKSNAFCQNDSCQTDSHEQGSKDRFENDAGSGDEENYDIRDMKETGRTRLEVNDVCYINGKFLILFLKRW